MPSTVIAHRHYFPETEKLRIVFVSGLVYDYKGVPQKVFDAFQAAFSKGIYFNRNIKPFYACEKVEQTKQPGKDG